MDYQATGLLLVFFQSNLVHIATSYGSTETPTPPSANSTDSVATSPPDTSTYVHVNFSHRYINIQCVLMCTTSAFICSYHHIVLRPYCWYCGSLRCCHFTDISSQLWRWSNNT